MQYSKYQPEQIENRNTDDTTTYPPSAKLHDTHYSNSSSLSLDTVNQTDDSNPPLIGAREEEEVPLTRTQKFKNYLRVLRPTLVMIFFDVALPLAIYYILKNFVSVLIALVLSGIPPLLHVIYTFWKKRRLDILGCIFVVSYIISAVLSLVSGDVRLALLRDSTTTAIVSFMFFVTLIPLRTKWFTIRPLIFLISQQMMAEAEPITWTDIEGEKHSQDRMEFIWVECRIFRKYCYILSFLWGAILLSEFIAKVIMIQSSLSVDQVVLYGNIIVITVIVSMTIGTSIGTRAVRKRIVVIVTDWMKQNDFTEKYASATTPAK